MTDVACGRLSDSELEEKGRLYSAAYIVDCVVPQVELLSLLAEVRRSRTVIQTLKEIAAADSREAWRLAGKCDQLSSELAEMESRKDAAYLERNQVVSALSQCFPSGVARTAIEGWSEDWHGCVYIDLPTGQVSWHFHDSQAELFAHLPPYAKTWDGHDTEEKYRRLSALRKKPVARAGSKQCSCGPYDAGCTYFTRGRCTR